MVDPVGAAVAAAEEKVETHNQINLTISSTGRHVLLSHPVDMTDGELLELVGFLGSTLREALARDRASRSPIVLARAVPRP